MKLNLLATVAAGLLATTVIASAQPSGAPGNERDRTGQPTDSKHQFGQSRSSRWARYRWRRPRGCRPACRSCAGRLVCARSASW